MIGARFLYSLMHLLTSARRITDYTSSFLHTLQLLSPEERDIVPMLSQQNLHTFVLHAFSMQIWLSEWRVYIN